MRTIRFLIGLSLVGSLLSPLAASAANIDVISFDKAATGQSLAASIRDGSIKPLVVEHYTLHDPKTHQSLQTDSVGVGINLRELNRYLDQHDCKTGTNPAACIVRKK